MFEIIYQISEVTPNYGPIIVAPVFWGFVIALVRERYFLKDSEFNKASRLKYLTWLLSCLLLAILGTVGIINSAQREKFINGLISGKATNQNLIKTEMIEGYVENFSYGKSLSKGSESFTVGGIRFTYTSHQFYGYSTYANNGGVIKPGIYVRVHFVNYDSFLGKIIFKVEEDKSKSKEK